MSGGDKEKKDGGAGKKSVEEAVAALWKRQRVMPAVPAVPAFHRYCPHLFHSVSHRKTKLFCAYPSVIFLRISSMLRLNSESSCIMVSIRPQAEMAVV